MENRPRYRVPDELRETLLDFTIAYLLERPTNLAEFGLNFFSRLKADRDSGGGGTSGGQDHTNGRHDDLDGGGRHHHHHKEGKQQTKFKTAPPLQAGNNPDLPPPPLPRPPNPGTFDAVQVTQAAHASVKDNINEAEKLVENENP